MKILRKKCEMTIFRAEVLIELKVRKPRQMIPRFFDCRICYSFYWLCGCHTGKMQQFRMKENALKIK